MGTNADHQRAWRQRQKAKLAELERQVRIMRRPRHRRPRQAKPTGEANDFIRELLTFMADYLNRINCWRKTNPPLSAEDRAVLMDRIHWCANELSKLAQDFLPEPTAVKPRTG